MPTWILGVSGLYHDAAVALLRDGEVVCAVQEERFSRLKADPSLPVRAARYCLDVAGIRSADLDWLVFYEKPLKKFERILATSVATFPRSWRAFPRQMQAWLGEKLWLKTELCRRFEVPASRVLFSEHHLSHAASAFLASPHDEAAILCVDGVGEWATTSLWRGRRDAPFIEPVAEVHFPHSLGLLYSAITAHLGFAVNDGEYKVMGMAAYGEPRFRAELDRLLTLDSSGGYHLDLDYFSWHWHPERSGTDALDALVGPPRFPGDRFAPRLRPGDAPADVVDRSQRHADLAASAQAQLEDAMLHLARHAKATVGGDTLCLAGGVALNSVANHRIARDGPFAHLWVQPAAGDAGGALGAALWAWHCVLGNPRTPGELRPDLGRATPRDEVRRTLEDLALPFTDIGDDAPERAAADLADGKVIGWYDGACEWGPRALGHRSILADPRHEATRDAVNASVKHRELFRPFAPSVLADRAADWFDLPPAARGPALWMLTTCPVRPERRAAIPAVVHVDGSARVQLVDSAVSPRYARLIAAFAERTGVPMVLNTSFNLNGEPIVGHPLDAAATFVRSALDVLYIDGHRVERPR